MSDPTPNEAAAGVPAWGDLFARAAAVAPGEAAVQAAVATSEQAGTDEGDARPTDPRDPAPTRVVAAPGVLVADLFHDGSARAALDALREHSWTTLVASDPLLDAAERAVAELAGDADPTLAADWRARVARWREPVVHPVGDDPTLASAYRGGAMHVLSTDERLTSAAGGTRVRDRVETSVREPAAFARLFDPAGLYEHAVGGTYDGPDRDPRD
ncbi:MAG: hypothetical protein ABEJ43_04935 [Haloferacaceae archaeon]